MEYSKGLVKLRRLKVLKFEVKWSKIIIEQAKKIDYDKNTKMRRVRGFRKTKEAKMTENTSKVGD